MKHKKPSFWETFFALLTLAIMWGGFIDLCINKRGLFVNSLKWLSGGTGIITLLFIFSVLVLHTLIYPVSKTADRVFRVKNLLAAKRGTILLAPLLILALSFVIYKNPRFHGPIGVNFFTFMLVWLFLLPIGLFGFLHIRKSKPATTEKTSPVHAAGVSFWFEKFISQIKKLRLWNWIWLSILYVLFLVTFFTDWNFYSLPPFFGLVLFILIALVFSLGLQGIFSKTKWGFCLIASILFLWLGANLTRYFMLVNNNPFSQGWSEGTWIFNASLLFAKRYYGTWLNPPILNTNRALFQAIPFLFSNTLPIWVHRMWEAILWVVIPLAFSVLLARKVNLSGLPKVVFIAWSALFLMQGPVYYFLFITPILILTWVKKSKFLLSLLLLVAVSVWIGIDRMNWFPLPGCLMTLVYIITTKYDGKFINYWWKPAVWVIGGTMVAILAKISLSRISGYPSDYFLSYINSTLLPYRLLPNQTNPMGILPQIFLAILPLSVILATFLALLKEKMHWSRRWMILIILVVFWVGDLLVSLKIGGGNNLHNFDGFLVLLLITCSFLFFGKTEPDSEERVSSFSIPTWFLVFTLLNPTITTYSPSSPVPYSQADNSFVLAELNQMISALPTGAKPVLFISETQLLATGLVQNVAPVPVYEMVFMMEMAMANNSSYLQQFYKDLSAQEYSLIIAPELNQLRKGSTWSFGEENNAWNTRISDYVLEYYYRIHLNKALDLEILAPITTR